jgi:hypothetical protein
MLRELLHQLFGVESEPLVWQDYVVALVGVVIFLMLIPVFRAIFFSLKRSARIAKTASRVACLTLAASWAGLVLDVFGYFMTMAIILPILALVLMADTVYVLMAKEG